METLGIEQLPDFAHFLSKFHNIYSTTHISSFCSLCEVHLTFLEADSWVQESTSWKPRLSDQRLSVCFDRSSLFWVAQHVLLQKTTCWLKILGKRWHGTCPQMPISPEEATQTQPRTAYCPGFCWNCNFGGSFMQLTVSMFHHYVLAWKHSWLLAQVSRAKLSNFRDRGAAMLKFS